MGQASEGADKEKFATESGQATESSEDPARRLSSAALQTSNAILAAGRHAAEELLRTRESLERSEARLLAIVDNAAEGIIVLEDMGRKGDLDRAQEAYRLVQEQVQRVKLAVAKVHSDLTA